MVYAVPIAAAAAFVAGTVGVFFEAPGSTNQFVRESDVLVTPDQWTGGTDFDIRFLAKPQSPLAAMQTLSVSVNIYLC